MKRIVLYCAVASLLAFSTASAPADHLGAEIDLSSFDSLAAAAVEQPSVWDDVPIEPVRQSLRNANRRFYITGMIGPSFADLDVNRVNGDDNIFIAGGAAGLAFDRRRGSLRLEVEGMGRDDGIFDIGPGTVAANNGWSVMQNVWRDVLITDRFGAYGGGGLGGAGYTYTGGFARRASSLTDPSFAWQFGGGLIYEVTDRLTFDVGYRYFHIDEVDQDQFDASELLFGLRFYEPFRRWR